MHRPVEPASYTGTLVPHSHIHVINSLLFHSFNLRWLPCRTDDFLFGPIATDVKRKRRCRCGKPVGLFVFAGRLRASEESQRAICVLLEVIVFGPERKAFQRVRVEEMMFVVESQRPEAVYGRQFAGRKCH